MPVSPPSPFVAEWAPRVAAMLPPYPLALDVAMGRGRHVPVLAAAGYRTIGADISLESIRGAIDAARLAGAHLRAFCADLTVHPLPVERFQLVLVSRYLDRERFPALKTAVARGGFVMYETFTRRQIESGRGPTSPQHLLDPGELALRFHDFDIHFSEESTAPDALARIVARRR